MVGPDLSGTVLDGRYQLVSLMGAGGMGQVYEGTHLALDRRVAIKVLPSQLSEDARFRARFAREARAAAKISHRNVVQIMDFGESSDGPVYFVMEFLEGRDLGALLRESGRLPWARARHFLLQATSAIKAAHTHGIIHRDIKPGNCFVLDLPLEGLTDVVKLLDFGIAKVMAEAEKEGSTLLKPLTVTGEMMGTASYMSPEQARCETMDARSDVYSLGIMAYEMLTGRVPFTGINPVHVATRHLFDRPEPLHRAVPDILPDVEAIVLRALAKEPEQRFQSMAELEAALLAVQEVSIESVPTRVLSAVGSAGRVAAARGAASGKQDLPTVVIRDLETKTDARVPEDSFEDAVTPDPLVLMPRFGEPFPLRPRPKEEVEPAPVEAGEAPSGEEFVGMDEVTSARIRIAPDSSPGGTVVMSSILDPVVEVASATSPPREASAMVAMVAAGAPEPSVVLVEAMAHVEPELGGASHSVEGEVPRRASSKGWVVVLGIALVLGAAAVIAKLVLSRPDMDASPGMVASGEAVEPVERSPTPIPVAADPAGVGSDEGAPARPAELDEPARVPAQGEPSQQASAPPTADPEDSAVVVVDDEPTPSQVPEAADSSAETVEAPVARVAKQKRHESQACQKVRDRAYRAHEAGEYLQVVNLAASGPCWPPSLKLNRLRMYQNALFETRQFTQCVAAGEGISDPTLMKMTSNCQKRLRLTETTSKSQ